MRRTDCTHFPARRANRRPEAAPSRPAPLRQGFHAQALERRTLFAAAPAIIDLMVVYTPQALSEAGSLDQLNYRVDRSIAETNMAFANSQVNASIRLVHEAQVNYSESGVILTDLNNIQSGAGPFSGVQAMRDQYGADLVSLWVGSGSGDEAGRAYQPDDPNHPQASYGYNIVQYQYADNNYVFAHETGHNLGAGHDRSDSTPRVIPIAYGKTFTLGNYTVGDIMSDTDRIPYYSNPNVAYQGTPTGNPDNSAQPADNAAVMNQFAPTVANYEPTQVPDATAPSAAVESVVIDPVAQTLTAQVEYADDTAVAVGRLGTGDIVVTGPDGFSQAATFQGIDYSSDGAQRVATYQVSIAGASQDPGAYGFTLEPGRLQDLAGNVAPGGALSNPSGPAFANRAGPRFVSAYQAGTIDNTTRRFTNQVNADNSTAFYRFTLAAPGNFTANLAGLTDSIDELLVQDVNQDGQVQGPAEILQQQVASASSPATISMQLSAGTYYLWVAPPGPTTTSTYTLTMTDAAIAVPPPPPVPPVPPTPPPPPPPSSPPPPPTGSVTGTIYNDANANGAMDPGEAGLDHFTVYADLNHDGTLDGDDKSAATDSSGNYTLTGVPADNHAYSIRVVPTPGWRQTFNAGDGGQAITLAASGGTVGNINFGQTQLGTILGTVFNDDNGDGRLNAQESSLAGWQVFLDVAGTGSLDPSDPIATTDAWGNFSFANVAPGSYTVRIVSPQGWSPTTANGGSYAVTLVGGGIAGGLLFGEQASGT
jgi:hypothetical protein